ncbi:snaclec bothroinsularin subunit beta-like [Pristis pectinata]|uniref:snaclec bothroinsularin subunit beta-like n=1 Tax=Pristis pectinata TaxID=685728 RepID=UPI00223CE44D|nr:snaclec bothroinsularin subunit beta-like [Pristis pectinata]
MMLVWVLVLTALFVSDVAGRNNSLEVEETQRDLKKREIATGPCDEDWFYYTPLNSCYRFFSQQRTWQEAEDFCNHHPHYGELASVTSKEHNTFISNVIGAVNEDKPFAWIGLNDRCKEGTYTWIDGSSWKYRNRAQDQPDNWKSNEDCVHVNYYGKLTDQESGNIHGSRTLTQKYRTLS